MNKMKNVWIMNHYATQMMKDKAGRHYWFAKKLKERGYKVSVFCASTFLKDDNQIDTYGKKFCVMDVDQIPFVIVKAPKCSGNGIKRVVNMTSFAINLIPTAKQYAKQNGVPDVIIASSVHPLTMVAGIRIAKKYKIPCICEIRDLWPEAIFAFGKAKENSLLGRILISGEHWIYKNADALIFTKEGDTDYLKERGWTTEQGGDINLNKCHYINNGVDLNAYKQKIQNECLDDNDLKNENAFNVVYAGVIRPVNQVDNILDCAKILQNKKEYEDVRFLIYGDGSELERLKVRVDEEKIENVSLKGFVERKYIPYILSHSSINLLNYTQTGYNWSRGNSSNKLFEYMASGKPIISTIQMGYSIIKKYRCGVELSECTPEAMAEAVEYFHDMDEETYAEYGRNAKEGVKQFDFDVLTEKLLKVIFGVVGEK